MRDSGGHSGNSFAETHIPLLMIGCSCDSNREKFYKQIDFAATFSLLNDLPIPSASIGSIIPEMLFNASQLNMLDDMKRVNQHLIDKIGTDGTEELKFDFKKAKSFHEMFANDSKNLNAYFQAENNYLASMNHISDHLAKRSLDVNLFQVLHGLFNNLWIVVTILLPTDDHVKDLKLTLRGFLPLTFGAVVLKLTVINEIFGQTNDIKSFSVFIVMIIVIHVVFSIFKAKVERFKWFTLFSHDLLYILIFGHLAYVVSVGSSSFVEEEHQIWYYFCSAIFAFLSFFELRGRQDFQSFVGATLKCLSFLILHIVIRRMNQTGDKWINVPDIGDWLRREGNQDFLHIYVVGSLIASGTWLVKAHCTKPIMIPFIFIGNVLLYFHHTRSINER
jgi:ethanolamine phosphate transferase 2 subunit G